MKKVIFRAALFVYSLLVGELVVRALGPVPLMPRFVTGAQYGVRMNIPNSRYVQTTEEVRAEIHINGQGMRDDKDHAYAKPPGLGRILVYGDSMLLGFEVNFEDSFCLLLERYLRDRGYNIEVLNMSVSGFGTAEMLVALESEGYRYVPDVVVFQWHHTDPQNNLDADLYRLVDGQLVKKETSFLPGVVVSDRLMQFGVYRWVIQHSHLYTALREASASWGKFLMRSWRKMGARRGSASIGGGRGNVPKGDLLSAMLILRAQEVSRSCGAGFLVLDTPQVDEMNGVASAMSLLPEWIGGQVEVLSPVGAFREAAPGKASLVRKKGHGHYTEIGNSILARVAADGIVRSGRLEPFMLGKHSRAAD